MKQRIDVSVEMVAFVGAGAVAADVWPAEPVAIGIDLGEGLMTFHGSASEVDESADLILVVAAAACRRLFGAAPDEEAQWHLPTGLRAIAVALYDCPLAEPARATLRLAKSIELLCGTLTAWREGSLVAAEPSGTLSELDTRRIVAARRLIDERWREKLTLDAIARACGLNRTKLTRGFRCLFACSVSEAIAERRLAGAHQLLLATDLPVSSIGYRCGYLNNASFTRAFSRRYGAAPSLLRAHRVAA